MAYKKRQRTMYIVGAICVVIIALVGTVLLISRLRAPDPDPYKQPVSTKPQDSPAVRTNDETNKNTQATTPSQSESQDTPDDSMLDPATVGTIAITPMNLDVAYVKGVGAIEYEVLRRPNGTQYVEFRSPDLVGTKCTDDEGAFASILADPQASEAATIATSTTVDGTKYGLSLSADSCTSDREKLHAYQTSFTDAFRLLKKID